MGHEIFPIHSLTSTTFLSLVCGFKRWAAHGPFDRLLYHIRVWFNSFLQNWLVWWEVTLYINSLWTLCLTNVRLKFFPIHLFVWESGERDPKVPIDQMLGDLKDFDATYPSKILRQLGMCHLSYKPDIFSIPSKCETLALSHLKSNNYPP